MDDLTARALIGRPAMPVRTSPQLRAIARLLNVPAATFAEPVPPVGLCASTNGDRWLLLRSAEGTLKVRHVGDAASGGHATDEDMATFLARDLGSPQHSSTRSRRRSPPASVSDAPFMLVPRH